MLKTTAALAGLLAALGCSDAGVGSGPRPEVAETEIKLDLPATPEFPEAKPYSDGSHSVTEMRLRGTKYLDQPIKITGYVVFNYDLATCAREVGDKAVAADPKLCEGKRDIVDCTVKVGQKAVADKPDQCDRPYFYLGDAANASFEKSIWVVEVPRPLRDDEKKDQMLVEEFKKKPPPPQIAVGDKVVVEGTWAIKSPMGFGNSEGLVVYGALTPATP